MCRHFFFYTLRDVLALAQFCVPLLALSKLARSLAPFARVPR
jgi:hypothetical protein